MRVPKRLLSGPSSAGRVQPGRRPRYPIYVSMAASLALMGDALLYAVLPTQAAGLGIPLVFVGVLLSANRFIRLVTNTWAASIYKTHGQEFPFLAAMLVASLTTFSYGLSLGVWLFLLARVVWGVCWSFLHLGMYFSVLNHTDENERGQWMGKTKAISRIGTIVAVGIGGFMTDRLGFRTVVVVLGCLALFGVWVARRGDRYAGSAANALAVPVESKSLAEQDEVLEGEAATSNKPTYLIYWMSFLFGFVMHGVVVGTMALLVTQRYGDSVGLFGMVFGAATFSGFLLGLRWMIEIGFAQVSGRIGDRFGAARIVSVAAGVLALMLVLLSIVYDPRWMVLCAILIFLAGVGLSICLDAVAGDVAMGRCNTSQIMSRYVTAQDFGAAIGPLVGYLVGLGLGLDGFYLTSGVVIGLMAIVFARQSKSQPRVQRRLKSREHDAST